MGSRRWCRDNSPLRITNWLFGRLHRRHSRRDEGGEDQYAQKHGEQFAVGSLFGSRKC